MATKRKMWLVPDLAERGRYYALCAKHINGVSHPCSLVAPEQTYWSLLVGPWMLCYRCLKEKP